MRMPNADEDREEDTEKGRAPTVSGVREDVAPGQGADTAEGGLKVNAAQRAHLEKLKCFTHLFGLGTPAPTGVLAIVKQQQPLIILVGAGQGCSCSALLQMLASAALK